MPEAARTIVACAALLGNSFDVALVAASSGVPLRRAHSALLRARCLDLIVPEPGRALHYRFRHDLTRKAVCDQIDTERRAILHARIAAALETLPDAASRCEQLAYHWAAAGIAERAAPHRARAVLEARLLGLGS